MDVGLQLPRVAYRPAVAGWTVGGGPGGYAILGPEELGQFVKTAEIAGFRHVFQSDHVLGIDPQHYPDWKLPWTATDGFYEPFVTLTHVAAITSLHVMTGILVLPQRQTAIVAKQAAQLDLLSGQRLRLGVGVGRNFAEYAALGTDFGTRGARLSEQITVLRGLWTQQAIDFHGRFHAIDHCGINPLPARSIPIWMGGGAQPYSDTLAVGALNRIGALADGWVCLLQGPPPLPRVEQALQVIRDAAAAAGRPIDEVAFEGSLFYAPSTQSDDEVRDQAAYWHSLGASHLGIYLNEPVTGLSELLDQVAHLGDILSLDRVA